MKYPMQASLILSPIAIVLALYFIGSCTRRNEITLQPVVMQAPKFTPPEHRALFNTQWVEAAHPLAIPAAPSPPPLAQQMVDALVPRDLRRSFAQLPVFKDETADDIPAPPPRAVRIESIQRDDHRQIRAARAQTTARGDICRGKGRYYGNGGRSWRCRR